jgi:hypothetical protein
MSGNDILLLLIRFVQKVNVVSFDLFERTRSATSLRSRGSINHKGHKGHEGRVGRGESRGLDPRLLQEVGDLNNPPKLMTWSTSGSCH